MKLHYSVSGTGETVILLHGMAASGRYWQPFINQAEGARQYIAIDLLGFGRSPHPDTMAYDYDGHISSIIETLRGVGITYPVTIVAHSMGALIALRLAATHPEMVKNLILCGLPYYPSASAARKSITRSSKWRKWAYYGRFSRFLCTTWCQVLRPISKKVAPIYLTHVPKIVAEDSLLHTWKSYSESMAYVIEQQNIGRDIKALKLKPTLLYGEGDDCAETLRSSGLIDNEVTLEIIPGLTHQLPLEQPDLIIKRL